MKFFFALGVAGVAAQNVTRCDKSALPECVTKPVRDVNGCPDCVPPLTSQCTELQKLQCFNRMAVDTFPVCSDVLRPEFVDCCFTCKHAPVVQCSETELTTCKDRYDALPECAMDVKPEMVDCCFACRKPSDRTAINLDAPCTKVEVIAAIETSPECLSGEEPIVSRESCAPSCRRPERDCTVESVAICLATRADCVADNSDLARVEGECCPTCVRSPPTCATTCTDTERCVMGRQDAAPRCASLDRKVMYMRRKVAARAKMEGLTKEQAREILKEVVTRFCERHENANACIKRDELRDGLEVRTASQEADNGDRVKLEVDVPKDRAGVTSGGRRLLSTASDLLDAATADAQAAEEFVVETATDASGSVALQAGVGAVLCLALLL